MKKVSNAYALWFFAPGAHRLYLEKPGELIWMVLALIVGWANTVGVIWSVKLGMLIAALMWIGDGLLIPYYVREYNNKPRLIQC